MVQKVFLAHYTAKPGSYELSPWDHRGHLRENAPEIIRGDVALLHALHDLYRQEKSSLWLYQSGVLAFNEPYDRIQHCQSDIIDSFEHLMFAGQDPIRFSRLWCLHLNESKVELHWCLLRADLISHRLVDWYKPCPDFPLFDVWEDLTNLRYGWASPKDPRYLESIRISPTSPPPRHARDLAGIKSILSDIVVANLQSRDHLCNYLQWRKCNILKARDYCLVTQYSDSVFILAGPCCHATFTKPSYIQKWMKKKEEKWNQHHCNREYLEEMWRDHFQKRKDRLDRILNHGRPRYRLPFQLPCVAQPQTSTPNNNYAQATNTCLIASPESQTHYQGPSSTAIACCSQENKAFDGAISPQSATKAFANPSPPTGMGQGGRTQTADHPTGTPSGGPNAPPSAPVITSPQSALPADQPARHAPNIKQHPQNQPPAFGFPWGEPWRRPKQKSKSLTSNLSPPDITDPPHTEPTHSPPTPADGGMDIS